MKKYRPFSPFPGAWLTLSLSVLVLAWTPPAGAQAPPLVYTSQLATEGAVVELRLNGFPVERIPGAGNQGATGSLAGAFLKQGENVVELRIVPMVDGQGQPLPVHAASFELYEAGSLGTETTRVLQVERTFDLDAEQPGKRTEFRKLDAIETVIRTKAGGAFGLLEWDHASGSIHHQVNGGVETIRISIPLPRAALANLPWQTPQPPMDAAAQTAIRAKVMALHAALGAKNWQAVEEILDGKLDRQALAFGLPRSEVFNGTLESLDEIFFSPGFMLAPLDPDDLQIGAVEELNLFKVTLSGGDPIQGEGDDYEYSMPLFFSLVGGTWEIVH